jgi:hypothetical protein
VTERDDGVDQVEICLTMLKQLAAYAGRAGPAPEDVAKDIIDHRRLLGPADLRALAPAAGELVPVIYFASGPANI